MVPYVVPHSTLGHGTGYPGIRCPTGHRDLGISASGATTWEVAASSASPYVHIPRYRGYSLWEYMGVRPWLLCMLGIHSSVVLAQHSTSPWRCSVACHHTMCCTPHR